ncbi:hypothetical protein R3P38DRAFT_2904876 [Favolaschia claudopus]|uniref:THH1/TOM1/TOM3 domain-containing protein n=1 Tax=Favolaschia claudopus TaxID=2862362 RepID=A0AAW0CGV9_9AGAR
MATNYAQVLGIQNKWAPILFAVIYFLLMLWYLLQAARKHGWIYPFLAFFSLLRVISFSLRAAIASNHHNDAFSRSMAIAYSVLYNVGYFSILFSAYRLLHDRRWMAKINNAREKGRSSAPYRVMGGFHKGRLMELLLLLCVILGAVGVAFTLGAKVGRVNLGNRLTDASTYLFLAATVIVVLGSFLLIHLERSLRTSIATQTPIGTTTQHLILLLISALLLLRILFYASTVHQRANGQPTPTQQIKQTAIGNEHLWYPLAALAELLVVLLFLAPGLIPLRAALLRHRRNAPHANEKGTGPTGAGYAAGDTAATGGLGAVDHGMGAV